MNLKIYMHANIVVVIHHGEHNLDARLMVNEFVTTKPLLFGINTQNGTVIKFLNLS